VQDSIGIKLYQLYRPIRAVAFVWFFLV